MASQNEEIVMSKPESRRNAAWLGAAALLLGHALLAGVARAEPGAEAKFAEEEAKQAAIYKSAGVAVPEGYVVDRSLLSYTYMLSDEFKRSLARLGPADRWLDIGAGEGRAVIDYCTSRYDAMLETAHGPQHKAKAIAMSIEDRRTPRWHEAVESVGQEQIRYYFGKELRDYSPDELGRFNLITDVLGGFSYTKSLSVFMERALDLLAVDGDFYTVLQDVQSETGQNAPYYPDSPYLTRISTPGGADTRVCSWLKSISCIEVTCTLNGDTVPPIEIYRIHKVCERVNVPGLVAMEFEAGTPPQRRFQLRAPVMEALKRADTAH
jgi:hypothetical protein